MFIFIRIRLLPHLEQSMFVAGVLGITGLYAIMSVYLTIDRHEVEMAELKKRVEKLEGGER